MGLSTSALLSGLPAGLHEPLVRHYTSIARNYLERRWEPAALNAGKLCEVVYSILDGATSTGFPSHPSKPQDMVGACRALEQRPADPTRPGDRSLRVLIPRVVLGVYEVRNNRGVGHVAGDVDSNKMDATMVFGAATWIICELVRVFHGVSVEDAETAVNALVERRIPEIWQVADQKRVLNTSLRAREQTLLLLYSETSWVGVEDLRGWIEYRNAAQYRANIIAPLHKSRLVEFDASKGLVMISPKGVQEVEDRVLPVL